MTAMLLEVELRRSPGVVPYPEAVAAMEARVAAMRGADAPELLWLLEHPPLYTAGTSAKIADLLDSGGLPVFPSGRGGQYTYHGPGQRIAYLMLDLNRRSADIRGHVRALQDWAVGALGRLGVAAMGRSDRIGVWVPRPDGGEDKIAAIGVRVRHWIAYHGIAINLAPRLEAFAGIVPCGIADRRYGVTSLAALGSEADMAELDRALIDEFPLAFAAPLVAERSAET